MTKGIPDPPQQPCCDLYAFGTCNHHHAPLFTVRPGVFAEDALVHAIQLVQQAYQSTTLAREDTQGDARRLLGSSQLSLEMTEALLNKVLDGLVLLATHLRPSGQGGWRSRCGRRTTASWEVSGTVSGHPT